MLLWLAHRAALRLGLPGRALADQPAPSGPFLPAEAPPAPVLPPAAASRLLDAARAAGPAPDWHGPFDGAAPALSLRLDGIRPVWEASRLAALPLLAQAARLDSAGGHLARAETLLAGWCAANPPFRGPNWACGQEAALRALHLALALALLGADRDPPPGARALLVLSARRIAATPLYALAQDNNHPVSEAAGAFACALLLGGDTRRPAAALAARVARLVAPDGGFAQVSAGYARLLLDVLSVAEWLRRRHGAPPFPAPLAGRAAALARWLHRLVDPATGGTPPLGLEDGSCFADLGLRGPDDARGSVERALRLFAGQGGDAPEDAGCAWLGLPPVAAPAPRPARWRAAGTMGWQEAGAAAVLRTGPLRFRPGQSDLLHLSLRDGAEWILRDGGTGSYDPPAPWWWPALSGAAGHDAAIFDGVEPMARAGRFLLARWPALRPLPDGAALRDAHGNRQQRRVRAEGRCWTVEDRLSGPFRTVALRWRLPPDAWRLTGTGLAGPRARILVTADAPLRLSLRQGWESPAPGRIRAVPVLVAEAAAPVGTIVTRILLPGRADCVA
ncbi:heparinase II/III domain-containing protein [Falsiroseomonas sp. CW058]|uniref:heparinase II/III domain-containing protein n=1 Tax=Falsiroseomonas sp. CW058 TaxID=3388664 RepID=UPI003D31DA3D